MSGHQYVYSDAACGNHLQGRIAGVGQLGVRRRAPGPHARRPTRPPLKSAFDQCPSGESTSSSKRSTSAALNASKICAALGENTTSSLSSLPPSQQVLMMS